MPYKSPEELVRGLEVELSNVQGKRISLGHLGELLEAARHLFLRQLDPHRSFDPGWQKNKICEGKEWGPMVERYEVLEQFRYELLRRLIRVIALLEQSLDEQVLKLDGVLIPPDQARVPTPEEARKVFGCEDPADLVVDIHGFPHK